MGSVAYVAPLWSSKPAPVALTRSLPSPTLVSGLAQCPNLMAGRPRGEFIFHIHCWAFWQVRDRQLTGIYEQSSLFGGVPFTAVPASGSSERCKKFVTSLNWTMRWKALRLRFSGKEGSALGILDGVLEVRAWRSLGASECVGGVPVVVCFQGRGVVLSRVLPWKDPSCPRALSGVFSLQIQCW